MPDLISTLLFPSNIHQSGTSMRLVFTFNFLVMIMMVMMMMMMMDDDDDDNFDDIARQPK